MIVISNRQRDDIVKYIDQLCDRLQSKSTREYNTKRLALKLKRTLQEKQPLSAAELRAIKKICRPSK